MVLRKGQETIGYWSLRASNDFVIRKAALLRFSIIYSDSMSKLLVSSNCSPSVRLPVAAWKQAIPPRRWKCVSLPASIAAAFCTQEYSSVRT